MGPQPCVAVASHGTATSSAPEPHELGVTKGRASIQGRVANAPGEKRGTWAVTLTRTLQGAQKSSRQTGTQGHSKERTALTRAETGACGTFKNP